MSININNYEEYFLLYADNELSQQERKEVEVFIKLNSELTEEFEKIISTVNVADESVSLRDKSFLLKKEADFINEKNYDELFVLYHDNELDNDKKIEVESFLNHHPELKSEFRLISQAKLQPDTNIVFAEKSKLYQTAKVHKVIPMILWRSMAAAVFIGFGFWILINQNLKKPKAPVVAVNENKISPQVLTKVDTLQDLSKSPTQPVQQSDTVSLKSSSYNLAKSVSKKQLKVIQKAGIINETENALEKNKSGTINIMSIKRESTNDIAKMVNVTPIELNHKLSPATENTDLHSRHDNTGDMAATNNVVKNVSQVSYADLEPNNDNYIFYNVPSDQFRKSKVGIFLKKVKRVVDRNDPIKRLLSGDEKQMVRK